MGAASPESLVSLPVAREQQYKDEHEQITAEYEAEKDAVLEELKVLQPEWSQWKKKYERSEGWDIKINTAYKERYTKIEALLDRIFSINTYLEPADESA
jgi:predicted nuclease with TOPRIM domain